MGNGTSIDNGLGELRRVFAYVAEGRGSDTLQGELGLLDAENEEGHSSSIHYSLGQLYGKKTIPIVTIDMIVYYVNVCTKPLSTIQCNKTLGQDKLVYTTHRLNALAAPPCIRV